MVTVWFAEVGAVINTPANVHVSAFSLDAATPTTNAVGSGQTMVIDVEFSAEGVLYSVTEGGSAGAVDPKPSLSGHANDAGTRNASPASSVSSSARRGPYGHSTASTSAVPALPGDGPYPGLVRTTTIDGLVPVIVGPDFVTESVTSIAVYDGRPDGGGGLFPPEVSHVAPHVVGPAGAFENPLKLFGAAPAPTVLAALHWLPQNVAVPAIAALPLPMTKLPPAVHWNTIVVALAFDER